MDVMFNESLMYKDTLKGASVADSGKEVECEVKLQGAGSNQLWILILGKIQGMKMRNKTMKSLNNRHGQLWSRELDDMAAYAFVIAEEEDTHEPITFQEAINSFEKDEWVRAMKKEMSFFKEE
nr:hypothetical protein [Tanacetum cinerariifolium]